ncbi:hypothetical protein Tco_1455102, partial [Tanacetum coccineum]
MKTKRKLVPKDDVMGNVGKPEVVGVTGSCVSHVGEGSRSSIPAGNQLECLVGRVVDGRHMGNINDAGLCSAGNVIDEVGRTFHVDEFIGICDLQTLGTSLNDTRKRSRDTTTMSSNTDGNGCSSSKRPHTSVDHTISHLRTSDAVFVPPADPLLNTATSSHLHVPNERNPTQESVASSSANRKRTRDVMSKTTTSNVGSSSSSTRRRLHSGLRSPPLEYKDVGKCDHSCEHCGACFWYKERSLCPAEGDPPRFLQLYVYDTENEVDNRMAHFGGDNSGLRRDIVEGAREYELPTGDMLGAIVYAPGPNAEMDFDIVIEQHIGQPQRVSKLHPSYMALQFPLLFVYGEDGYSKD